MALAWKAGWVNSPQGFESPILRHRNSGRPPAPTLEVGAGAAVRDRVGASPARAAVPRGAPGRAPRGVGGEVDAVVEQADPGPGDHRGRVAVVPEPGRGRRVEAVGAAGRVDEVRRAARGVVPAAGEHVGTAAGVDGD